MDEREEFLKALRVTAMRQRLQTEKAKEREEERKREGEILIRKILEYERNNPPREDYQFCSKCFEMLNPTSIYDRYFSSCSKCGNETMIFIGARTLSKFRKGVIP